MAVSFFMIASQAIGDAWWWPASYVEVVPQNPTPADVVAITLGGEWPDSCIPRDSAISVAGNDIYFDVIYDYPPGTVCLTVISGWSRTESVGPLSPGTYTVYARLVGDPQVPQLYTLVTEFVVRDPIIYVNADGSGDYPTIQAAIDAAMNGDKVIVFQDTYNENISFNGKNIIVTSLDPENLDVVTKTIIDGCDANSVVTFSGTETSNCVLRGFTIRNGRSAAGGGIYGNGTMATIEYNLICDNAGVGTGMLGSYGDGGGLFVCDGLIQYNIITSNDAGFGGGLCLCNGTIRNNIISRNGWYAGSGLSLCGGLIENNLIIGNEAVNGAAVSGCDGLITNCTVADNFCADGSLYSCNGSISNCIIWGNTHQLENRTMPSYSCIEDWVGGGLGNTSADPMFVSSGYWNGGSWVDGDYHLKWLSPCVNVGDPNRDYTGQTDIDGGPRVRYGRVDMGAYEVFPLGCDFEPDEDVDLADFAAFAIQWQTSGYQAVAKLTASDGQNGDLFGGSVSISGNICVVGASGDPEYGICPGAAYVYRFDGSDWALEQELTAADGQNGDLFGISVSVDGNLCVVGACGDDDKGDDSGSCVCVPV